MGTGKRFSAKLLPDADPSPVIVAALACAAAFAEEAKLDERDRDRLAIVVEELASNALRHGAGTGGLRLELIFGATPNGVELVMDDDGVAFDPTTDRSFSGPNPETGGGVGIALVRAWAREIAYTRLGDHNRLALTLERA